LKTRTRNRPACELAVPARTANVNTHDDDASNVPLNGAGVLNALAVEPVRKLSGFGVEVCDENVDTVAPASKLAELPDAVLATFQPSVLDAAV
jgi:hypothetical protein